MLDGRPLVDVHLHAAHKSTLKIPWDTWVAGYETPELAALYDDSGAVSPVALDALLATEGVDAAIVLAEYSPRVTGWQTVEQLVPLTSERVKFAANVNPHVHHPVVDEVQRQLDLGAVALKIHPVHAGLAVNDRALYPAYELCQSLGLPIIVHCGTSTFSGASNKFGDPVLLDDVLRDFPRLDWVLAHGGRGWWYDAAAFLALSYGNVWIELSGLPPSRLQAYYAKHSWPRLTRRMIFATDWPGVPGIARNARAVSALLPDDETRDLVLWSNAARVYNLKLESA